MNELMLTSNGSILRKIDVLEKYLFSENLVSGIVYCGIIDM